MNAMDWSSWHDDYDQPGSALAQRLEAVQTQVRAALDRSPAGPLQVISMCAGQGRDLIEVLADHPRRDDVKARLVELDPRNTAYAEETVRAADLGQVEVLTADASLIDHYRDLAPADLVMICGVFGNISDEDIERTIDASTQLCKSGGTVLWTRHRGEPDLVPQICEWFESRGFTREYLSTPNAPFGAGAHRYTGSPRPLTTSGTSLFTFTGRPVGA